MKINPQHILKNKRWLDIIELRTNLDGVEYIIMASPAEDQKNRNLTHFTLFLNTKDNLPESIAELILNKFIKDHEIKNAKKIYTGLSKVAFAITEQETPMPIIAANNEANSINMFVIEFTGASDTYKKTADGYTGWSYIKK